MPWGTRRTSHCWNQICPPCCNGHMVWWDEGRGNYALCHTLSCSSEWNMFKPLFTGEDGNISELVHNVCLCGTMHSQSNKLRRMFASHLCHSEQTHRFRLCSLAAVGAFEYPKTNSRNCNKEEHYFTLLYLYNGMSPIRVHFSVHNDQKINLFFSVC